MNKEDLRITTYEDDKGYVFVSYSSKNGEKVFDDFILPLQKQYGLNVFCDADFKNRATQNWTTQMKENIESAQACILFVSDTYVSSYACLLEVLIASFYKIPIIRIKLEEPHVSKEKESRDISESTQAEFKRVGKKLQNANMGMASNCFLEIEPYIVDEGRASKYNISKAFIDYLKAIKGTYLKEEDGLEAIKNSIEKVQKENVFEDTVDVFDEADEEVIEEATEEKNVETGKSSSKGKSYTITGDITYKIYGEEYTDNQSNMMINVFEKVLSKNPNMLPGIIDMPGMNCLSETDYSKKENRGADMPSYFRTGRYLQIASGVYVGTSYSVQDKVKKIAAVLAHCNESKDTFEAYDDTVKEVFDKYSNKK